KLLAKWRGRELLGHVLLKLGGARAAGLLANVIVVHRPEDEVIRAMAHEYRASAVATRRSDGELSDSLRTGIEAISSQSDRNEPSALLICMGDQPLIRLEVIRELITSWRGGEVAALRPSYRDSPGEPGHPLLIDRSLWSFAGDLRGESGLGPVLARRGIGVKNILVGGRNPDVDTRE